MYFGILFCKLSSFNAIAFLYQLIASLYLFKLRYNLPLCLYPFDIYKWVPLFCAYSSSLSTALGYATASDKLNFIFIGDLSFFYDMNALWNANYGSNVRILLLNNEGGEIFHALPGLEMADSSRRFITATHRTSAKAWAEDRGFQYLSAHNEEELDQAVEVFTQPSITSQPMLMEVFTEKDKDIEHLKTYYHNLKK